MKAAPNTVAVVGLGNMGSILASNLAEGNAVVVHDDRGPACASRAPRTSGPWANLARRATVVVLSLPDGAASDVVAREILAVPERSHAGRRHVHHRGARRGIAVLLAGDGVAYLDAPVSGGVAGAGEDAGGDVRRERRRLPARNSRARRPHRSPLPRRPARPGPGDEAGQQLPLATSLLATSEAIAFGLAEGLGWEPCSTPAQRRAAAAAATSDKFPDHVVTRRYASGFANSLMAKDVQLYLRAVEERGTPAAVGAITASVWTPAHRRARRRLHTHPSFRRRDMISTEECRMAGCSTSTGT